MWKITWKCGNSTREMEGKKMGRMLTVSIALLALLVSPVIWLDSAAAGPAEDAVARGEKLFADAGLGTNDKSCNSCHTELGKGDNKLTGRSPFPKVFSMAKKVRTLDQTIQLCITGAMKGPALAWDDDKLADLASYVNALYQMK
jgi:mono/diheme cytochrome c family protein